MKNLKLYSFTMKTGCMGFHTSVYLIAHPENARRLAEQCCAESKVELIGVREVSEIAEGVRFSPDNPFISVYKKSGGD